MIFITFLADAHSTTSLPYKWPNSVQALPWYFDEILGLGASQILFEYGVQIIWTVQIRTYSQSLLFFIITTNGVNVHLLLILSGDYMNHRHLHGCGAASTAAGKSRHSGGLFLEAKLLPNHKVICYEAVFISSILPVLLHILSHGQCRPLMISPHRWDRNV